MVVVAGVMCRHTLRMIVACSRPPSADHLRRATSTAFSAPAGDAGHVAIWVVAANEREVRGTELTDLVRDCGEHRVRRRARATSVATRRRAACSSTSACRSSRACALAMVGSGAMVDSLGTTDWRRSCSENEWSIVRSPERAAGHFTARAFGASVDLMPRRVGERVVEDAQRPFPVGNLDAESLAGLRVGDGDDSAIVALMPEQQDIDAVVRAPVELAEVIAHDAQTVSPAAGRLNAASPSSASGWPAT